ncbi:hypothetical protein KR018_007338, partial [Drosophila ironensis]
IDAKRVEYHKYLERAGVIEALRVSLTKLYGETSKPEDAIRFVRKFLCETCPDDNQYNALKAELDTALEYVAKLSLEMERARSLVQRSPEEVSDLTTTGYNSLMGDEENQDSLLRKYLTPEVLEEIMLVTTAAPTNAYLYDCILSGLDHHDSPFGFFAADVDSFNVFSKLVDPMVKDYHRQMENEDESLQPDADFGEPGDVENLDASGQYIISTRIRASRNVEGMPLFPKLRERQILKLEEQIKGALALTEEEDFMGTYVPLADMDEEMQADYTKRNLLFKHDNVHLKAAGAYRFWPAGRGVFTNASSTYIVWVNTTDHLHVISMAESGAFQEIYGRLVLGLEELEKSLVFARHPRYGFVSANVANLGTGFHASVYIRLPKLSKDPETLGTMAEELDLLISGIDGTPLTEVTNGVLDVSHRQRLGKTEFELLMVLIDGIKALITAEENAE